MILRLVKINMGSKNLKIKDLMSINVISVHIDDRLIKVKELFEKNSFHHLMVINDRDELVGVISDRDYTKAIHPNVDMPSATTKDLATLNKRVHQIMKRDVICIFENTSLRDAIKLFYQNKISCLPVVDSKKQPIGVVSWRDLLGWLYEKVSKTS
jgi:acetoin utilization protein AcuB